MKKLAILSCLSLTIAVNCSDNDADYSNLSPHNAGSGLELGTGAAAVAPESILTTREVDAVTQANTTETQVKADVDLEAGCCAKFVEDHGDKLIACGLVAATPCIAQLAGPYAGIAGSDAGQLVAKIFLSKTTNEKLARHLFLTLLAGLAYITRYNTGSAAGFDYLFVSAAFMSLYFHAVDIWEKRNRR